MASVTKNPFIMQSANYVYNWFISINEKNNTLVKTASELETVFGDEMITERIRDNTILEREELDFDKRLEKQKMVLTHDK